MRWFAYTLFILILVQAPACRHSEDESAEATAETIIRNATRLMQDTMEPIYSPDSNLLALMTVHQKILDIPVAYDRTQLQGLTFVLAQASGDYIVDSTRVSAPANGSRFTLYETTVDGLTAPLVEIGYVDVSWTEQSDGSVTIEVKAVANSQEFISYAGSGEPQDVDLTGTNPRKLALFQAANIDLAARELSLNGELAFAGRQLDFEYFRNVYYEDRVGIDAINRWRAPGSNDQYAYYWSQSKYGGIIHDSEHEISFDLVVEPNTLVNIFTRIFNSHEVRIDGELHNTGDSTFATVTGYCHDQMTGSRKNIHKLMAPAMYSLLVVL